MDTADVLRRKRAKLAGQIEFIDELLAEMGQADAAVPVAVVEAERPRAAAPKAARPAPKTAGKLSIRAVADLLFDGPKPLASLAAETDVSGPTVRKLMEANPDLFRKTHPENRLSPWELTELGRRNLTGGAG